MDAVELFQKDVKDIAEKNTPAAPITPEVKPIEGAIPETPIIPEVKLEAPKKSIEELSDDEIKELVAKRGISLAPKEIKQKTDADILASSIQYGISEGKFKMEQYDEAVKIKSTSDKDLVFNDEAAKIRAKNSGITDEEIQKRLEKKFAASEREVEDTVTGEKTTVYIPDEDEIKERAEAIRKKAWTPIDSIKNEYQTAQKVKDFSDQVEANTKKYASEIPSKIKITVGESDSFDFDIEESMKPAITQKLIDNYKQTESYQQFLRNNGIKIPDSKFDVNAAVTFIVKNEYFDKVMDVHANERVKKAVEEALKPYKNSLEKPLETTQVVGKPLVTETPEQAADRWIREKRGY